MDICDFTIVISFQSCIQDDCGNLNEGKIKGVETNFFSFKRPLNSGSQYFQVEEYQGGSISYKEIFIEFEFTVETLSYNNFGITSGFACSPAIPIIEVEKVSITSNADYSSEHQKGTNLVEILKIHRNLLITSGQDLHSHLSDNDRNLYGWQKYYLSFLAPPSQITNHRFQIQFT